MQVAADTSRPLPKQHRVSKRLIDVGLGLNHRILQCKPPNKRSRDGSTERATSDVGMGCLNRRATVPSRNTRPGAEIIMTRQSNQSTSFDQHGFGSSLQEPLGRMFNTRLINDLPPTE